MFSALFMASIYATILRMTYNPLLDGVEEPLSGDPMEGVAVVVRPEGAAFLPVSVRSKPEEVQTEYLELVDACRQVFELQTLIERQVPVLRELGVTWSAVGWALGIDGDAARKRFGASDG